MKRDDVKAAPLPHRSENSGDDVILSEKLRYAHGAAHVRDALARARLAMIDLHDASTRTEAGTPVPGLVVVARKRASGD